MNDEIFQTADKNKTNEEFINICNITVSQNDFMHSPCLNRSIMGIEIDVCCNDCSHKETYAVPAYPFGVKTFFLGENCTTHNISRVELKNDFPDDLYRSACQDATDMSHCNVQCFGNSTCLIDTTCMNQMTERCFISKYLRTVYECIQGIKMAPFFAEVSSSGFFGVNISCPNQYLISIKSVLLEEMKHSCRKNVTVPDCKVDDDEILTVNVGCNNHTACMTTFKLNASCAREKEYAFSQISYNCSNKTSVVSELSPKCIPVNETYSITCGQNIIQSNSSGIQLYPSYVGGCLNAVGVPIHISNSCNNVTDCDVNLLHLVSNHSCMEVHTKLLKIDYTCAQDSSYTKGSVTSGKNPLQMSMSKTGTTTMSSQSQAKSSTQKHDEYLSDRTTNTVPTHGTKSTGDKLKGNGGSTVAIVAGIIGAVLLVVCMVIVCCCIRRWRIKTHKNIKRSPSRHNSVKDYTGIQMIAYPDDIATKSEVKSHPNDIVTENSKKDHSQDLELNRINNGTVDNGSAYSLAKPILNDPHLSDMKIEMTETDNGYSMAKRISKLNTNPNDPPYSLHLTTINSYEDSQEGVYDQTKNGRYEKDTDVYDRATDSTYDTAHGTKQHMGDEDNAYDHFTGPKTTDNYEIVTRHNNKAICDETYGVN
ncbi:uncharacterized protein LOC127709690 isoform X2 [Mytilus californianus]|nr:uncharacterized protein LOC127709690 isoform X2 [Mytilus californianus]XP_052071279.1 uncharacterized protein LOC127709690 isoform X2 [Mytilus californianus]